MSPPRVLLALPEHACAVRGAFNQVFCRRRSEVQWRHIYEAAPLGGFGVVALNSFDRVLGYYGATVHRLQRDGNDIGFCAMARDAFTRPEARLPGSDRRPLLARLFDSLRTEALARGCRLMYGFSSERHFKLGSRLLNYKACDAGRHWHCDFTSMPAARRPALGKLERVTAFDPNIDALGISLPGMALRRDASYLNWRFAPEYGGEYQCYVYRSLLADAPAGYAVIARRNGDTYLADAVLPDNPVLLGDLWRQLGATLQEQRLPILRAFCAGPSPLAGQFGMLHCQPEPGTPFGQPCYQWLGGENDEAPAMILTPSDYDAI